VNLASALSRPLVFVAGTGVLAAGAVALAAPRAPAAALRSSAVQHPRSAPKPRTETTRANRHHLALAHGGLASPRPVARTSLSAGEPERSTVRTGVGRWSWPLSPRPRVVRPFVRPAGRYGPGHRGVDLDGPPGQPVLAVDSGTVAHVGVVAGRGTVTLLHASGLRSTYEPVLGSVTVGQPVARGSVLGRLTGTGSHCSPAACLHLGAMRGTEYLDPMQLLESGTVRLLPLSGAPG
jgi:murein DD-endopeptidase MepM/ murein hydrolase activator NlpD